MVRPTVALSMLSATAFVLLLAPDPLNGQVAAEEVHIHTVEVGETLSRIAETYYGDPADWTRILEANRDRLESPERLRVGMELAIPGVAPRARVVERVQVLRPPSPAGTVPVTDAEVDTERAGVDAASLEAVRERQLLGRYIPFEPAPAPSYPGERTVFFEPPGLAPEGTTIEGWRPEETPPFPEETFRGASWLLGPDEEFERLGRITNFAGDQDIRLFRTTIQDRDLVRAVFEDDRLPDVGERFILAREGRHIQDIGTVVLPTARAIVRRVSSAGAVLEVIGAYDRAELGDYLVADRRSPVQPGARAEPTEEVLEAWILAFERPREIQLRNDRAFLDVGRAHGVRPGDEFVLLLGEEEGWDGRVVARFQVLDTRETNSTVRLLSTTSREVGAGLSVRLDRRMP